MSKKVKRIIGIIIVIVLIIGVIWLLSEYAKPEQTSLEPVNELPNEDMEEANVVANIMEETSNEVTTTEEENVQEQPAKEEENSKNDSEVVSGTSLSREEQAVELAKKYYEQEYGSIDGVNFEFNDIYKDGRYIITVGNAGVGSNTFLYVNLSTGEVSSER